jgi:fluoroacetyl-CoA thioesterase
MFGRHHRSGGTGTGFAGGYRHTVSYVSVKGYVHAEVDYVVAEADTALALHTGDVPVLGTPKVIALCEEAAVAILSDFVTKGQTTVSSRVEVAHVAPVAVGSPVRASATLERSEGRRLVFNVSVTDACGLVAAGKLTRIVVDREQFIRKAR